MRETVPGDRETLSEKIILLELHVYTTRISYSERMSLLCLVHCSQNRLVNPVEK
jgi:hypothetical protein